MKYLLFILFAMPHFSINAQNDSTLPYQQIPEYPENFDPGNVISRMIDGLGYRYYWATEGLKEKDLNYKPSEDSRTSGQTVEHLYGLSTTILNTALNQPNIRPVDWSGMTYSDFRKGTLENLKKASETMLGKSENEIAELQITFQRGENVNSFSYWHMLNGPIADALYHTGQVVAFRRASGNPINPKVNVFTGKTGD